MAEYKNELKAIKRERAETKQKIKVAEHKYSLYCRAVKPYIDAKRIITLAESIATNRSDTFRNVKGFHRKASRESEVPNNLYIFGNHSLGCTSYYSVSFRFYNSIAIITRIIMGIFVIYRNCSEIIAISKCLLIYVPNTLRYNN